MPGGLNIGSEDLQHWVMFFNNEFFDEDDDDQWRLRDRTRGLAEGGGRLRDEMEASPRACAGFWTDVRSRWR